mgnify:CR=1 FL=1
MLATIELCFLAFESIISYLDKASKSPIYNQFLQFPNSTVEYPMFDHFWMSVMKELVDIAPDLIKDPNSSMELHEHLIVACSFALNYIFTLPKDTY